MLEKVRVVITHPRLYASARAAHAASLRIHCAPGVLRPELGLSFVAVDWHATSGPGAGRDDLAWLGPSPGFELLADDAGINPEKLREWLRDEIERRRKRARIAPALNGQ